MKNYHLVFFTFILFLILGIVIVYKNECKYRNAIHTMSIVDDINYLMVADEYENFLDCYHDNKEVTLCECAMISFSNPDVIDDYCDAPEFTTFVNNPDWKYVGETLMEVSLPDLPIDIVEQYMLVTGGDKSGVLPYGRGLFLFDDREYDISCYDVYWGLEHIGFYCPDDPDFLNETTVYEFAYQPD